MLGSMVALVPWQVSGLEPEGDAVPAPAEKKPAANPIRDRVDRARAASQNAALVQAIKIYQLEYSIFPSGDAEEEKVLTTGPELIGILTGRDRERNPKEVVFIEARPAEKAAGGMPARSGLITGKDGSQRLVDPWGNEYGVVMDLDFDEQIKVPGVDDPLRAKVVAWSYGKPKDPKDPGSAKKNPPEDWISSWAEPAPKKKKKGLTGIFNLGKASRAKRVELDLNTLKTALNVYRLETGTFPTTEQGLDILVNKPTEGDIPDGWQLLLKSEPLDPWGNPYGYRFPPEKNQAGPDIWSFGPDGVDGSDDDLGNW